MKIDYKICIAACVFCLILGGLIVQSFSKPEIHTVTTGGLKFTDYLRDMFKPKFPHLFFFKGEDGKTDSFTIYKDAPIGEIPVVVKRGTFNIPYSINDEPDSTWWGSFFFSYQGIGDSLTIEIPQKDITLKTCKKFLTFHKSLSVSIDGQKRVLSEMKVGLTFGSRLTLYGGLSYRSDNELTPTVGLLVNF